MSILITGGTGFIGAGLARLLLAQGEDVVLFDSVLRIERVADIKDKLKVIRGDVGVWPEVMNAVKENNIEGIFHLGAMLSLPSEDNPWASYQTNVAGTMHVLEQHGCLMLSAWFLPAPGELTAWESVTFSRMRQFSDQ